MNNSAIEYLLSIKQNKYNLTAFNNELTDIICSSKSSENLSLIIQVITDMLKEIVPNSDNNIYIGHLFSRALEALLPYLKENLKYKTYLLALYTYDFEELSLEQKQLCPTISSKTQYYLDNISKIKTHKMLKEEAKLKNLSIHEFKNNLNIFYTIYSTNNGVSQLIEQFKSYSELEVFISKYGKY